MAGPGKLFIVPTPIGNLEDITLRALRILKEADLVVCEDTRESARLLNHYQLQKELLSFHTFNEHQRLDLILDRLRSGQKICLVSDAGTPGISDPGFLLSRACHQAGIPIECLPGPTAFVPALVASGLPADRFLFEGFLPHKKGRQTRWKSLALSPVTVILYESPFRLLKCLEEILEYCGPERMVCVARELTKIHEEVTLLPASEMLDYYRKKPAIKGEVVVLIAGVPAKKEKQA